MLYTPHFLTGAAIARVVPNPYIALPLAVLSHILLDLTPHNDFGIEPGVTMKDLLAFPKKRKMLIFGAVGADMILMIICAVWLWNTYNNVGLLAGGLAGIAPDAVEQGLMVFGLKLPGWFNDLQWRVSAKYGFISYPIVSLLAFSIINS